jgi:shikimate dehydrogenase
MENMINGETKLCCLIGKPVSHSLSPLMHNYAFKKTGLNIIYIAFNVNIISLKQAIEGLKALQFIGANVTLPYKSEIINYIDEIDETAKKIGAVNTIYNVNNKLIGYNTDSLAAIDLIKEKIGNLEAKKILLIGAGGVAKAISYILVKNNADISIFNRTINNAFELKDNLKKYFGKKLKCQVIDDKNLETKSKEFNIVINATSLGMIPQDKESPISKKLLDKDMLVFDTVYNPLKTKLIREAMEIGCQVIPGYKMLVKQGAISFKIWTGIQPPIKEMEELVYNELMRGKYG